MLHITQVNIPHVQSDSGCFSPFEVVNGSLKSHVYISLPGILIKCVPPCRSRNTGETAVVGEELIFPLSALGERFPLTRTAQEPPPWTNPIQLPPVYLHIMQVVTVDENPVRTSTPTGN